MYHTRAVWHTPQPQVEGVSHFARAGGLYRGQANVRNVGSAFPTARPEGMASPGKYVRTVQQLRELTDRAVAMPDSDGSAGLFLQEVTSDVDRDAVSHALRAHLGAHLTGGIDALEVVAGRLLDLAFALTNGELADSRLPLILLEDLFDARPTRDCERLFQVVEQRRAVLAPLISKGSNSKLVLLRTCNELLRRLSKQKNTHFCGRILMLMAYLLPLSERSGVNARGLAAINPLDVEGDDDHVEGEGNVPVATLGDVDNAAPPAVGSRSFYRTFWGVQSIFQTPHLATEDDAVWERTCAALESILDAFSASPTRDGTAVDSKGASDSVGAGARPILRQDDLLQHIAAAAGEREGGDEGKERDKQLYFSKFLTSPKLIELQMGDSYFRRHILVQIISFCQTVCVSSTKGPSIANGDQQRRAGDIRDLALQQLATTGVPLPRASAAEWKQLRWPSRPGAEHSSPCAVAGPNASCFAAITAELDRSERAWIAWKRGGCPNFERFPEAAAPGEAPPPTAARQRQFFDGADKRRKVAMGSQELTRLWNIGGDSLADLAKQGERTRCGPAESARDTPRLTTIGSLVVRVPTLEDFLAPVVEQMDPEAGIEEAFKIKNDKIYAWKALRLMRRTDLQLDDRYLKGGLEEVARALGIAPSAPPAEAAPADTG